MVPEELSLTEKIMNFVTERKPGLIKAGSAVLGAVVGVVVVTLIENQTVPEPEIPFDLDEVA